MAALKSGPHDVDLRKRKTNKSASWGESVDSDEGPHVSSAVKGEVESSVGDLDEVVLDLLVAKFGRVDKLGRSKAERELLLAVVGIDRDDPLGLLCLRALEDGETDAADTEDSDVGLPDSGRFDSSSVTGRDTATEETGLVERCLGIDGDDGVLRDDGVLGEGGAAHLKRAYDVLVSSQGDRLEDRGAHIVVDVLSLALESGRSVRHHTFTLGGSNGSAKVADNRNVQRDSQTS